MEKRTWLRNPAPQAERTLPTGGCTRWDWLGCAWLSNLGFPHVVRFLPIEVRECTSVWM